MTEPAAEIDPYTVLYVTNDLATGGAQTFIESLGRAKLPHQRMVLCVLSGRNVLSDRMDTAFDEVVYLDLDRSSWDLRALVTGLRKVIADVDPDVVHSHLLQADLAVLLAGGSRTKVCTIHTTGMTEADPLRSRVLGGVLGLGSRSFDAVIASESACLAWMDRMHYSQARTRVILNGIALTPVTPRPRPTQLLSLARWHPMKDHATTFDALRALRDEGRDITLVCAGSGMAADNPELVEALESRGISDLVELLGPRNDVPDLLAASQALLITSAYGEASPLAGLEALAAARPVVATDVGGTAAMTVDPLLVAQPRDLAGITDAIRRVLDADDETWQRWSDDSRALVERVWDIKRCTRDYDALYRELMAGDAPTDADASVAVVCLTPHGGHIEHAYNTAAAVAERTGRSAVVISRPGAASYLPTGGPRVHELPADTIGEASLRAKITRSLRETRNVRKALKGVPGLELVVLEEPQMVAAAPLRRGLRVTAIIHNAREHSRTDPKTRLLELLKVGVGLRADRVVVHGEAQQQGLPKVLHKRTSVVELPGIGAFEAATAAVTPTPLGAFLCIGEVRRNKNIEEAVRGAALAGQRLVVAGKVVDDAYWAEVQAVVASSGADVDLRPEFLSASAFSELLAGCIGVVLPYGSFAAQSGVMERALPLGTPVLAVRLPALVEQGAGREGVYFYEHGSPEDLAALMTRVAAFGPRVVTEEQHDDRWATLAAAVASPLD